MNTPGIINKFVRLTVVLAVSLVIIWSILFLTSKYILGYDMSQINHNNNVGGTTGEIIEKQKDKLRLLLVGTNQGLTDTIMYTQYDPEKKQVSMLSIPRDTKISESIDGKINSLFSGKYYTKLVNKVEQIVGLPVDYYVFIDKKGLRDIIDAIGGVTVYVPINMNYDDPVQKLHIHLKKGTQKLNGSQAEQFVRFRKNNDGSGYLLGDVDRTKAQQSFMKAVSEELLQPKNILKIGQFSQIFFENIKTDAKMKDLLPYVNDVAKFNKDNIITNTLPGEGKYVDGVSYFVHDKIETKKLVEEMFIGEELEIK